MSYFHVPISYFLMNYHVTCLWHVCLVFVSCVSFLDVCFLLLRFKPSVCYSNTFTFYKFTFFVYYSWCTSSEKENKALHSLGTEFKFFYASTKLHNGNRWSTVFIFMYNSLNNTLNKCSTKKMCFKSFNHSSTPQVFAFNMLWWLCPLRILTIKDMIWV